MKIGLITFVVLSISTTISGTNFVIISLPNRLVAIDYMSIGTTVVFVLGVDIFRNIFDTAAIFSSFSNSVLVKTMSIVSFFFFRPFSSTSFMGDLVRGRDRSCLYASVVPLSSAFLFN